MQLHNDLEGMKTSFLETMIKAHSADYGRALTADEEIDEKETIALLQAEIKSRKKPGSDIPVISQSFYKFLRFGK
jgi:hypothetical protein